MQQGEDAEEQTFGVHPPNWRVLELFDAVSREWELIPQTGYLHRLDWARAERKFRWLGVAPSDEQWLALDLFAAAFADEFNRRLRAQNNRKRR